MIFSDHSNANTSQNVLQRSQFVTKKLTAYSTMMKKIVKVKVFLLSTAKTTPPKISFWHRNCYKFKFCKTLKTISVNGREGTLAYWPYQTSNVEFTADKLTINRLSSSTRRISFVFRSYLSQNLVITTYVWLIYAILAPKPNWISIHLLDHSTVSAYPKTWKVFHQNIEIMNHAVQF